MKSYFACWVKQAAWDNWERCAYTIVEENLKRERKWKRRKGRTGEDGALEDRRFVSLIEPVDW